MSCTIFCIVSNFFENIDRVCFYWTVCYQNHTSVYNTKMVKLLGIKEGISKRCKLDQTKEHNQKYHGVMLRH